MSEITRKFWYKITISIIGNDEHWQPIRVMPITVKGEFDATYCHPHDLDEQIEKLAIAKWHKKYPSAGSSPLAPSKFVTDFMVWHEIV